MGGSLDPLFFLGFCFPKKDGLESFARGGHLLGKNCPQKTFEKIKDIQIFQRNPKDSNPAKKPTTSCSRRNERFFLNSLI